MHQPKHQGTHYPLHRPGAGLLQKDIPRPLQEQGPPGDCAVECILKPRTNARPLHLRQEPAMRAMTPSVTSLMSPVFHDLTIENESGGVIARNVGSLQAAHERRAVVRSSPAA